MSYPLVLELAAEGLAVTLICRVLGFSAQGFYQWKKQPVTQRDWDDAHLIDAALDIHDSAPEFGCRLVADALPEYGTSPRWLCRIGTDTDEVASLCAPMTS